MSLCIPIEIIFIILLAENSNTLSFRFLFSTKHFFYLQILFEKVYSILLVWARLLE